MQDSSSRSLLENPSRSEALKSEREGQTKGIALCLSGGGFRAMLFHLGSFIRLNEAGILGAIQRISSVSGGSIAAGMLGLQWKTLAFVNGTAPAENLQLQVIAPLRALAGRTIDVRSVFTAAIVPGAGVSDRIAQAYDRYLFANRKLSDLPDDQADQGPRFVFNATNIQTGSLWRFSKPFMGDYQVGLWSNPDLSVATAVAASSAFPPVLSPAILDLHDDPDAVAPGEPTPAYRRPPFTTRIVLCDGGVYDNLGLETAYKRYGTILVSDGGMKLTPDPEPHEDWAQQAKRIYELTDNQVRALRKRVLIQSFIDRLRTGTYWGIRTHLADYGLKDPSGRPDDTFGYLAEDRPPWKNTDDLAAIPTRLAAIQSWRQEALINWGYVVCDAALRAHINADLMQIFHINVQPAGGLPYPNPA